MKQCMILLAIVGVVSAQELITNGAFEQEWSIGWSGDSSYWYPILGDTIDRAADFHPDPDYEVRVKKYDHDYAKVYQTVTVPLIDYLTFHVYAKFYAIEFNPLAPQWAAASIVLSYLNNNDSLLGETRICYKTPHCPWTNSPTFHMIEVTDTINWSDYSFNIDDELVNLPGINPSDIAKITVALFDTTDGC